MTAFLRIGWALLLVGTFAGMIEYAVRSDGWRCFAMGIAFLLVLALRRELTEERTIS